MLTRGIAKSLSELRNLVSSQSPSKESHQSINDKDKQAAQLMLPANVGTIAHPPIVSPASLLIIGSPATSADTKGHINNNDGNGSRIGNTEKADNVTHLKVEVGDNASGSTTGMAKPLDERAFGMMPAVPAGAAAVLERSFRAPREPRVTCLLYTSPSPRDQRGSRMPSSA